MEEEVVKEEVLKLNLAVLRRDNEGTLDARRCSTVMRLVGSVVSEDAVEDADRACLSTDPVDEVEVDDADEASRKGAGAAGGHDGAAAAAGAHRSLKLAPEGMLEKEVIGGFFRTGEPRTGMSMMRGLPAGRKVMARMVISLISRMFSRASLSELTLDEREERDWDPSASLMLPGPNSTRESRSSSSDNDPSSSLERYHSCGSAPPSLLAGAGAWCSSMGVVPSRPWSSTMTLSSILETRLWLLCGRAGGSPGAGRVRMWRPISLSASRSS